MKIDEKAGKEASKRYNEYTDENTAFGRGYVNGYEHTMERAVLWLKNHLSGDDTTVNKLVEQFKGSMAEW